MQTFGKGTYIQIPHIFYIKISKFLHYVASLINSCNELVLYSYSIIHSLKSQCCCLVAKSCLTLATPWTVACQVPLSMGFPRQEYISSSKGSSWPMPPALGVGFFTTEPWGKRPKSQYHSPEFFFFLASSKCNSL